MADEGCDEQGVKADPSTAPGGLRFGLAGVAGVDFDGPLDDVDARLSLSMSTKGHRSPASSPGRRPHMRR